MIEVNKNYNESNLETMAKMPDCFVDLTVTSPPYDGLRTYNGYSFPFEDIAKELYRITKQGGIIVWIVGDATVKGSESGTSFRQALYFKEIGFNLHDTMIWEKTNPPPNDKKQNRYVNSFEYMFVFSKGKPKTCNYITTDSKHSGKIRGGTKQLDVNDTNRRVSKKSIVSSKKPLTNIWKMSKFCGKVGHPAPFPEQLANDHIISWSNENDLIYDPFMGSGTTAKMAMLNNRNYIGSEISSEYCDIIEERIKKVWGEKRKEKDLHAGTLFGNEM